MTAPAASVKRYREVIGFTALILLLADLQCHYFLADAGASHVTNGGRRLSTLGTGAENARARTNFAEIVNLGSTAHAAAAIGANSLNRTRSLTRHYKHYTAEANTATSRLEVEVLTAFKSAIGSDPLGALKSWHANDSTVCGWAGVVCSPQRLTVALYLSGVELAGNINSALLEIGKLRFLQRLDLSDNAFSGSIRRVSLANISNLSFLNLSHNQVSGNIPSQLGDLVNLETLDFQGNNLTGEIPVSLGNCTSLRVLNVMSNFLHGHIPPTLGRLSSLEYLNLGTDTPVFAFAGEPFGTNFFSGSIPPALGNCSYLTYLDLSFNVKLGGKLPLALTRLQKLQSIELGGCSFEGVLPAWLVNLTNLHGLAMPWNQLQGQLPNEIGQLRKLVGLALGTNNFTGVIPISITNCTALTILDLHSNYLAGDFPPQLGLLRNLEVLYLWGNSFTGVIPSSLANCSSLTGLNLGYNSFNPQILPSWIGSFANMSYLVLANMNLEGNIPEEIGILSNLQFLALPYNFLSGVIPSSLGNCTSLTNLYLSVNTLTGKIPLDLGLLTYLTSFTLDRNFLTGPFPSFTANFTSIISFAVDFNMLIGVIDDNLGKLSYLQQFIVGKNHFEGPIPESLTNCSELYNINLSYSNLTGGIPPSFGNLSSLEGLYLAGNLIGGSIPQDIVRCSSLVYLDLGHNNLEGKILPNIGELSFLQYLFLDRNNFTGPVPSSLGSCSDMLVLDLSDNQLDGRILGDIISSMPSLISLNLSNNLFTGLWPTELSQLTAIQKINMSSNDFSGSLPASLENCTGLELLDISINNLTGVIPKSLGLLPVLGFFNASYNNLDGPIPDFKVSLENNLTDASFLGNPGLCGVILGPQRQCSAQIPAAHNATMHESCEGFKCRQVWIGTMCGGIAFFLIATGILCWMNIYRCRGNERINKEHYMLYFASRFNRVSEKDVLKIIDGGGENVIGLGARSVVYRGFLPGVDEMTAIKTLPSVGGDVDRSVKEKELIKEVQTLAKLRHRNILKVLSFCSTLDVKAMILEYMPEGSLHKHLHELGDACQLTWQVRFKIARGVAEAIYYLHGHHGFPQALIHGDLKPSNILLDANLEPKVADFGLSKVAHLNGDGDATASTVCGTIGYMPPEYAMGTSISTKGDIYSYGVVLLELLTGRSPTSWDNFQIGLHDNLNKFLMDSSQEQRFELLDSTLKQEGLENSFKKVQMLLLMKVAMFSARESPAMRPSMSDVVVMLKQIEEVGLIPIPPKTMEDLANETIELSNQDPSHEILSF